VHHDHDKYFAEEAASLSCLPNDPTGKGKMWAMVGKKFDYRHQSKDGKPPLIKGRRQVEKITPVRIITDKDKNILGAAAHNKEAGQFERLNEYDLIVRAPKSSPGTVPTYRFPNEMPEYSLRPVDRSTGLSSARHEHGLLSRPSGRSANPLARISDQAPKLSASRGHHALQEPSFRRGRDLD
jgi:hypothetical protein